MSLAIVKSRALAGMQAPEVTVEVHLAAGLPSLTIVGLPDTEVKESRDRVRSAIQNSLFEFPSRRITVNLAPADLPKESGRFDLPIALGILAASGQIPAEALKQYEFAGELSLSGELRPIRGALAMSYALFLDQKPTEAENKTGFEASALMLPRANADEAVLVKDARVYPALSLRHVCAHLCGEQATEAISAYSNPVTPNRPQYPDMQDVIGQWPVKRALEIAAAGGHHVIMVGPPGTGKSMLAARFPGILPMMDEAESLSVATLYSVCHLGFNPKNWGIRPFRSPHHSASPTAIVGGGSHPKPGEISLAHQGVLFLDELPEFDRKVLETLREPLETGHVTISRAVRQAHFPSQFQLIAAMNPCPCGYLGHPSGRCLCRPEAVKRYQKRISGPLLDRIDLQIEVPSVNPEEFEIARTAIEPSATIAERVIQARQYQYQRQGKTNQLLQGKEILAHCTPTPNAGQLLRHTMNRFHWSARAYHRTLKLARTIADLKQIVTIDETHIAEAIQYRRALVQ